MQARTTLHTDRVLIYRFLPNGDGVVTLEAAREGQTPIIGQLIYDPCLQNNWIERYRQGQVTAIPDIEDEQVPACHRELLQQFQVQANLVVPILSQGSLWGLLMVHHCCSPRAWQPIEVQYLQQLAALVGIAVQQAALQLRVQQRTLDFQQSEARWQFALEGAAGDGVWDWNLQTNQVFFSQQWKTMLGYTEQDVGDSLTEWESRVHPEDQSRCYADLNAHFSGHTAAYQNEHRLRCKDGSYKWILARGKVIEWTADGNPLRMIGTHTDITQHKEIEIQLRLRSAALEACADIIMITNRQAKIEWVNPAFTEVTGYSLEEVIGKNPSELVKSGQQNRAFYQSLWATILAGQTWRGEMVNRRKDGSLFIESETITPVRDRYNQISHFIAIKQDITTRKRLEQIERQRIEQERLMNQISQHIRQSLDLHQILNTAVAEVRKFLDTDRVIIYRLNPDWTGVVMAESVAPGWLSILDMDITDSYFVATRGGSYHDNHINVIPDIYNVELSSCHLEMMESLQVRAKLVVPILHSNHIWGLLIAHQCDSPRDWQPLECELMMQLATQMAIAIQQSELHHQVRLLNTNLELQVQERTAQLQQSLTFEELLKRITDHVRDSLDEQQILQTVVEELASGLPIEGCDTGIYNADQTTSTIAYEFTNTLSPAQGKTFAFANSPHPELYPCLFQGQVCQFCDVTPNPIRTEQRLLTALACPIQDERGVLGDIWLFKASQEVFNDLEVRLVQQVANQCAIALRQSRLYQAAEAQVKELERLHQLKDDFLNTVSHELRTPMCNIRMATQMLEISLQRLGVLTDADNTIHRYFHILREEGQREIDLINDLLDLARFDAGMDPLHCTSLDLQLYIPQLAETFIARAQQQQQQFLLQIAPDLPPFTTDRTYLERILTELLNNACKYTPAGEAIVLSVQATPAQLEICVRNSGVEIPQTEYDRIFDKFYRIPNNDPWKYGGTGLGLALVKKLTECLGGTIRVESKARQTAFILQFQVA